MARPLKPDAEAFRAALLGRNRHGPVYHWTGLSNIRSILEHGILCRHRLREKGIAFSEHGYGRAGKDLQFDHYVCVSLYPQKGMMRRETGPLALLEVQPALLYVDRAFYCPGNSARNEYDFDELVAKTELVHLEELFEGPGEWRLKDWQAEIWVPEFIAAGDIIRISFATDAIRQRAAEMCEDVALAKDVIFAVQQRHFPEPIAPVQDPEDEGFVELGDEDDEFFHTDEAMDPLGDIIEQQIMDDFLRE